MNTDFLLLSLPNGSEWIILALLVLLLFYLAVVQMMVKLFLQEKQ